jgi:hypothetical protein
MRSAISLALITFCAPWVAGCGSGSALTTSSSEEATVSGTVKIRGKPIDGGELLFNASNPNRRVPPRPATIGSDGSYTIKALVGYNVVTLAPPKARNKKQSKEFFGAGYDDKYVVVEAGENRVDLEFLQ